MKVKRVDANNIATRAYVPAIAKGLGVTGKHVFRKKDTQSYPEEEHEFGERYRGVPVLVKDQDGREKCVACYMCQFVCPPKAITIEAAEFEPDHDGHQVEKYPARFDINMLRCIYCGECEEVCPEEAIFMSKTYVVIGHSRELMIFDKKKLYELGGSLQDDIKKWDPANKGSKSRSHLRGDDLIER